MSMPRRQQGLTLIELMIAMMLSLILMAGVIQVFLANKQAYRFADALSRNQENGRFATEFITRELRMAGYLGCATLEKTTPNILANQLPAPAPQIELSPDKAVEGSDDVAAGNTWGAIEGTDVVIIRGANLEGANLTGNLLTNDAEIKVAYDARTKPIPWDAGSVLMVTDCQNADVFRATTVSQSSKNTSKGGKDFKLTQTTIAHSSAMNSSNFLSKPYGPGSRVMSWGSITYYVANDPDTGEPALYRSNYDGNADDDEVLIEGVEDLQILYGEDTDGDGNPDIYRSAAAVASWGDVVSARISLLVRSTERFVLTEQQNLVWTGRAIDTSDRRLRQIFTTTIALRNRLV
jgi:type IV pilus assembly protein PilW